MNLLHKYKVLYWIPYPQKNYICGHAIWQKLKLRACPQLFLFINVPLNNLLVRLAHMDITQVILTTEAVYIYFL